VQSQHDGHGGRVIDRHDAGHDAGRAEWDQAADQAKQFVGTNRGTDA
jgi:hypothetical protein